MKIVTFADIHCGVKNYGKIDKDTGLNEREIQTLNLFNDIVTYSINNDIDAVVFAGDMYKNNTPSPTLINKVNELIIKIANANIKVFMLDGNHDVSKMKTFTSGLTQFSTLHINNVIQTRFYHEEIFTCNNIKYKFVFLPTHHTTDEINELIKNLDTSIPTIIIGHLSLKNAKLNDWNIIDNEECIDSDIFNKKGIISVILGHLHKHQILNEQPLVYYTGSTNRIDFSEEHQDKGFVVLDINNYDVSYQFVHLNAQKFKTIKINCNDCSDNNDIEKKILSELNNNDIKDAILRIQLNSDNDIVINEKKILEKAYQLKVQYMLKIQKLIHSSDDVHISNINNAISVFDALEKYYDNQKRSKERIILGKEIVNKIENS